MNGSRNDRRVVIAVGSPAYAAGLAAFVGGAGLEPVVAFPPGRALGLIRQPGVAVAVVGLRLPDAWGGDLAGTLARRRPDLPLLLAVSDEGEAARDTLRWTAAGLLLAWWSERAVVEAVRAASAARRTRPHPAHAARGATRGRLTEQERAVARLMRSGLTYKEIALALGISWHTARTHAQAILRKLGLHSRRDLGDGLDSGGPAI
jgi:two-component system response regulator NreC